MSLILCVPFVVHATSADLGIDQSSITFSDKLVAGSTVRIYGVITNYGDVDVAGYVSFFQGTVPIDDSQVISVRAGGVPEEVYVDFIVPNGEFNVRAEIRGTDPSDENATNDVAITRLFTPIFDDDGDGVENDTDNCPQKANATQVDTDGDLIGDACDDDDDDDGLTDDVETELGTSPISKDTDGDGVADASDAYPSDTTRSVIVPVVVEPVVVPATVVTTLEAPVVDAFQLNARDESVSEEDAVDTTDSSVDAPDTHDELSFSPRAVFSYARDSWNTFEFKAVTPEAAGYQYQWDFGDGVESSRATVRHTYSVSGDFEVSFRVVDPNGSISEDSSVIHVRFWTLQNRVVEMILAFLSLLLLIGMAMIAKLSGDRWRGSSTKRSKLIPDVVQEDERLDDEPRKKIAVRNLDNE